MPHNLTVSATQSTHPPELYFHVGLGKVASTYLQYRFFPKLDGITYIQRTRYKHWRQLIPALSARGKRKLLFSREFDRQFDDEVNAWADIYPDTHAIILLRRHDSWMASQYRRAVKNGFGGSFTDFLDLDHDRGSWKQQDVLFYPKLQLLAERMTPPPLVIFHDDFKADAFGVFDRMANYMGASYDRNSINTAAKHRSYSEKQLKYMRRYGAPLITYNKPEPRQPALKFLARSWRQLRSYSVLYSAQLLPESWVDDAPLIPPEALARVRTHFAEDWQQCQAFAKALESNR